MILSLADCSEVLWFLSSVQPREPRDWWNDPKDAPSHVCGLHMVLHVLENSISQAISPEDAPAPVRPQTDNVTEIVSRAEGLRSAARLLRVAVAAFGEDPAVPWGDTGFEDILEVVRVAKGRVKTWLKAIDEVREQHVFDALDVLNLAEAALATQVELSTGDIAQTPLRGAIRAAAEMLDRAIEEEDDTPENPDDDVESVEEAEAVS